MHMDRDVIIEKSHDCNSMSELAERLGGEDKKGFWEKVSKVCPGFEKVIERNRILQDVKKLIEAGDEKGAKEIRKQAVGLTSEIMQLGLVHKALSTESGAGRKAKKEVPALNDEPAKELLKASMEFKCECASEMVLGVVNGEEYFGRKILMVQSVPGLFGEGIVQRKSPKRYTVHNGHINHCDIREGECPTPYWAVMDAMSELGRFTKDEAVELAIASMKKMGSKEPRAVLAKGCSTAFNVLTTHQTHPSKNKSGMSHMLDKEPRDAEGKRHLILRGRRRDETLEHFVGIEKQIKKSEKDGSPIMSVTVKEPV